MARYSAFLGRRVEVHYRAGDILLPASGTFVADSGRSVFLEQHLVQKGQPKYFRWEIPYQYIVRLEEKPEAEHTLAGPAERAKLNPTDHSKQTQQALQKPTAAAATAHS
jgi:hypothetical protein